MSMTLSGVPLSFVATLPLDCGTGNSVRIPRRLRRYNQEYPMDTPLLAAGSFIKEFHHLNPLQ
jgi:hypothetical protein